MIANGFHSKLVTVCNKLIRSFATAIQKYDDSIAENIKE